MKNLMLFCAMVFATMFSYGQTVNDIPIEELDSDYVLILGHAKFLSSKVRITMDFGQRTKFFGNKGKTMALKDEERKLVEFNSMIDALNFMEGVGYSFVNAYVITEGSQNVYHWLVKRKPKEEVINND